MLCNVPQIHKYAEQFLLRTVPLASVAEGLQGSSQTSSKYSSLLVCGGIPAKELVPSLRKGTRQGLQLASNVFVVPSYSLVTYPYYIVSINLFGPE